MRWILTESNRFYNATAQLNAGVRLLSAQVHNKTGLLHLCHTDCGILDAGRLSDWLAAIRLWMDHNPNEVVTILLVNSDNAPASQLDGEFQSANVTSLSYVPPSTTTPLAQWPTLQDMISNSTRLVTFVANLDSASNSIAPYLLDEFTFVWENTYDVSNPSNFSCLPDRPGWLKGNTTSAVQSGRLALMNHFMYTVGPFGIETPDLADITNTNAPSGNQGNLGDTAANCTAQYGKPPNFILVDFWDQGPAIDTVDKLNKITPVGRINPGGSSPSKTSSASSSMNNPLKPVIHLANVIMAAAGSGHGART